MLHELAMVLYYKKYMNYQKTHGKEAKFIIRLYLPLLILRLLKSCLWYKF